jgi:hypothetical protein
MRLLSYKFLQIKTTNLKIRYRTAAGSTSSLWLKQDQHGKLFLTDKQFTDIDHKALLLTGVFQVPFPT